MRWLRRPPPVRWLKPIANRRFTVHALAECPKRFEFSSSNRENDILVENHPDGVVVHAARANISPRQKSYLIRHLAAEGFIPERYRWVDPSQPESGSGLRWVVDASWMSDCARQRRAFRQILRLIFWAGLFGLGLMIFAFLQAPN